MSICVKTEVEIDPRLEFLVGGRTLKLTDFETLVRMTDELFGADENPENHTIVQNFKNYRLLVIEHKSEFNPKIRITGLTQDLEFIEEYGLDAHPDLKEMLPRSE
jgi:hypothetical protein